MTPEQILLLKAYDLNKEYHELDGLYPLLYAAKYGIVEFLKNKLSSLNPQTLNNVISLSNQQGLTALHFACLQGYVEASKILLMFEAPNTRTKITQQMPIHLIFSDLNSQETCEALFALMQKYVDIREKNALNQNVAHFAAAKNMVSILMKIKTASPDLLDYRDNNSLTPLLTAVLNNQFAAASYLLENSNIHLTNSAGQNALHIAVKSSTIKMLALVLPCFDVRLCDNEGMTALDLARALAFKDKEAMLCSQN